MTDSTTNPQPPTHMTDNVIPQPTPQEYLNSASCEITSAYTAMLKAIRDVDEAKASIADGANSTANMRKLVGYVWKRAIQYSQEHVNEELHREVRITMQVEDELESYGGLEIRVRGAVDQEVVPSEVGIDFDIPTTPDAGDLDEILSEFHRVQINLSKG